MERLNGRSDILNKPLKMTISNNGKKNSKFWGKSIKVRKEGHKITSGGLQNI